MLTLKTVKGRHIVTYNGEEMAFKDLRIAWKVAKGFYQLNK